MQRRRLSSLVLSLLLAACALAAPAHASVTLGALDTPGEAYEVAVDGTVAYVADGSGGLRIADVTDPALPFELGSFPNPSFGGARDVVVAYPLAYVAQGQTGLVIVDVSNPAAPALVTTYDPPGGGVAVDVELAGSLLLVADSHGGLRLVDVSVPALPAEIGAVSALGDVSDVELQGAVAWLATATGIHAYDVSVPSSPQFLSNPSGFVYNTVEVVGHRLYTDALDAWDVSDPAAPLPLSNATGRIGDFEIDGERVLGTVGGGFAIADLGDPDRPVRFGDMQTCGWRAIEVAGGFAYCTDLFDDFRVWDVSDPMRAHEVASLPLAGNDVRVLGRHAYFAGTDGLSVIDVTDPTAPAVVGTLNALGGAGHVDVWAGVAAIGVSGGIGLANVSNPAAPSLTGFIPLQGSGDTQLRGDLLYVAAGLDGFRIYDVADPLSPQLRGAVPFGSYTERVVVQDDVAYTTTVNDRLRIFDVADASAPALLADVPLADVPRLEIAGTLLYATHIGTLPALSVIDVSDPSAPVTVGELPNDSIHGAYDALRVVGALGFPTNGIILDLSDPSAPQRPGVEPSEGQVRGVTVANGLTYLAEGSAGLRIVVPAESPLPQPECANGLDDDGDGKVDHPSDVGCSSAGDWTELPDCSNGVDDDRDGWTDHPNDPSCVDALANTETRPCSDGLDNDGDGKYDAADPQCGNGWGPEKSSCGFGAELALALGALRLRRRLSGAGAPPG